VLVARIIALLPAQGVTGTLSSDDVVAQLRARKMLVTYRPSACSLEPDTRACGTRTKVQLVYQTNEFTSTSAGTRIAIGGDDMTIRIWKLAHCAVLQGNPPGGCKSLLPADRAKNQLADSNK
jgi:hypothetical protein